jgi:two-component sensor histidine kinase
VHDITDLKRAEDQIKKSLAEKEVLLHEINHRVKNNLQVMSSLLRLQSRQVSQKNYSNVLKEAQNRLHTMALIHEKLFQSRSIAHIDVEAYLKRLVAHLSYLYGVKSSRIKTIIDAQGLQLKVDKADPIGLIANELISNCFKYAFPEGRQGTVSVSFSLESNEFQFMVSDNGVGLREDLDTSDVQTLGLQLVNTLVKQLHGIMIVKRSGGTEFLISFPVSTS